MRYEDIIEQVKYGDKFSVDLKERSVKLNGKYIDLEDLGIPHTDLNEALMLIENHYIAYEKSVPSERNNSKRNRYFIADKFEELSDYELCTGEEREVAQISLELLVLGLILNNSLVWNNEIMGGNWFWRSKKYPKLVILKDWINKGE